MKKTTFIMVCMVCHFLTGAQPERVDATLYAGYGLLSDVELIAEFSGTYSKISSGISGEPQSSEYGTIGPFIVGYRWFTSPRFTVGLEFNAVRVRIREHYIGGEKVDDRFFFVNLSARCDFRYMRREAVQLYSGLALGPSYIFDISDGPPEEDRSGFFLSYQFNALGIRVGRVWAWYAELGFGRNGVLTVGISRQLQQQ